MIGTTGKEISFADSNIWLYALLGRQNPQKYQVAKPITELPNIVVSVQVINEVCANLLRKAKFSEPEIQKIIASFHIECRVIGFDEKLFLKASDLRQRYKFSY